MTCLQLVVFKRRCTAAPQSPYIISGHYRLRASAAMIARRSSRTLSDPEVAGLEISLPCKEIGFNGSPSMQQLPWSESERLPGFDEL